jgi:Ca2+-dependent lipid-binding protein
MVTVVQGRNIKKVDYLSQADAFVKVTCGMATKVTKVKDNTKTPQWNERYITCHKMPCVIHQLV